MQQKKQALAQRIEKYLNGEATEAEARQLERWLHALDLGTVDDLDQQLGSELKARIDLLTGHAIKPSARMLWWKWSAAASIAVLIGVAAYFNFGTIDSTPDELLQVNETVTVPQQVVNRYTNSREEEETLTLSDDTKVTLLKGSTLIWKQPFDDSSRTVELLGSGYFDVAKVAGKPFSVLSGDFTTTAIGTSFWVRQDPKTNYPEVNLVTGKVMIQQRGSDTGAVLAYLNPGETLRFRKSGKFAIITPTPKPVPIRQLPEIKEILEFNNTPLDEVLTQLSYYYDVDIRFSSKDIEGMSFYGTYSKEHGISEILQTIGLANGLHIERQEADSSFTISK